MAVIQAIFSREVVYCLCAVCEAVLDVEALRCPTHGAVGENVVRVFTPGAVETWLLPETYELLTGQRSRRHRDEPTREGRRRAAAGEGS